MAGPWYVSSVNGNDSNDGLSKANAKATVDGASGILSTAFAAGEELRIDSAHDESWGSAHTLAFPGTEGSDSKIISIDWTSDSYTKATTRQLYTTAGNLTVTGYCQFYGLYMEGAVLYANNTNNAQWFDNCTLKAGTASVTGGMSFTGSNGHAHLFDTELISGSALTGELLLGNASWRNGPNNNSKISGTAPAFAYRTLSSTSVGEFAIVGVDLSLVSGTLFNAGTAGVGAFQNCLLNAAVTVSSSINGEETRVKLLGCDDTSGNDLYRTEVHDYYGSTVVTDSDYNDSGASDGTTNIAWKMVSNANALEFHHPHRSLWISRWIDSTGSKTFTIETNSENVTYQDDELWMEVEFLGASTDTQSDQKMTRMANPDSTPANVPDSTDNPTWTTPNITTEKKQKLELTATVNRVGPYRARVCLAKPSATVWIDPKVKIA